MQKSLIASGDAYKWTHPFQYPTDLDYIMDYGEPRAGGEYPEVCFVGFQPLIIDNLIPPTKEDIEEAMEDAYLTFGDISYFDSKTWERVRELGYIPVKIRAVPEGTVIEQGNALFIIEPTEKWFATSVGLLETMLMNVWYPTTVCTRAMYMKRAIKPVYMQTANDLSNLPFALNDFGARGVSCPEQAAYGGLGHLVHFQGSDNMSANRLIRRYYGYKGRAKSVWATEHSVATSYGLSLHDEKQYLVSQLTNSNSDLPISVVIDSVDSDNFIQNIVSDPFIVDLIKRRKGRVVFRPDSGDPKRNVLKYLDMLGSIFGFSMNKKAYKVLNDNVGLIQGDGINEVSGPYLYQEIAKAGWSADNLALGSGGGLLVEGNTRDTSRWAIKACYGKKNGIPFDIAKSPKTDPTKSSKKGEVKLHRTGPYGYTTMESSKMARHQFDGYVDAMVTVYENGVIHKQNFEDILKRANQ